MAADCASIHTALADMLSHSMAADCASIHAVLGDVLSRSMAADCALHKSEHGC